MFMVGSGSLPIEGGGTHPTVGFSPGFQLTMGERIHHRVLSRIWVWRGSSV